MRRGIDEEIEDFIKSISDLCEDEPLDGDETEDIANKILAGLNQRNGND